MKKSARKRNRRNNQFQKPFNTQGQSKPKNPDRYGKLWNTIEFSLEGARKNAQSKAEGIPVIGTLKIGGKSFDITWTEATRLMETLQDAKHQYNVAERMGMLEPGTGTPIPVWSKTY